MAFRVALAAVVLLWALPAAGQEAPLVVYIQPNLDGADPNAIRQAISDDLRTPVVAPDAAPAGASPSAISILRDERGRLLVTLHDANGVELSQSTLMPVDPAILVAAVGPMAWTLRHRLRTAEVLEPIPENALVQAPLVVWIQADVPGANANDIRQAISHETNMSVRPPGMGAAHRRAYTIHVMPNDRGEVEIVLYDATWRRVRSTAVSIGPMATSAVIARRAADLLRSWWLEEGRRAFDLADRRPRHHTIAHWVTVAAAIFATAGAPIAALTGFVFYASTGDGGPPSGCLACAAASAADLQEHMIGAGVFWGIAGSLAITSVALWVHTTTNATGGRAGRRDG